MIEFYHKYFQKNYTSKIRQLILDIERLCYLEKIEILNSPQIILNESYKLTLDEKDWIKINQSYNTLKSNEGKISKTLSKFISKTNRSKSNFSFIDTFAGCGGLSLGLEKAGFNPVLINEIESKYLESYYFNHHLSLDSYFCGDIKDIATSKELLQNKYSDVDLVVGGPPCQGFSMANRQRIIDDPRNKLYKYYLELLTNTKPKFFIMENVKGMMKKSNEILENFHDLLGNEYTIEMVLLNAKDFGVPQNRERVFVIGSRLKNVKAAAIVEDILKEKKELKKFFLKDALHGLPILYPKKEKNAKDLEDEKVGFKFTISGCELNDFTKNINFNKTEYLTNHTNRFNNDRDVEIFSRLPQGANSLHESITDIMPYSSRNHMFKDKYFKLNENEVSKTITSHMKYDCNMYIHPSQSRGLSPREAARIQTFPDDFIFMGSKNNWYAQIGNAVPVKLAEVIGKQIIKHLK